MEQRGCRFAVNHNERTLAEAALTSSAHGHGHFIAIGQALDIPVGEHQRLGGVKEHGGKIEPVGHHRIQTLGGWIDSAAHAHGHGVIKIGQVIDDPGRLCDILHGGIAALACLHVDHILDGRSGAEMNILSFKLHGRTAGTVIDGYAAGGRIQALFNQTAGNLDKIYVDNIAACVCHQLHRFRQKNLDAGLAEHLQTGLMDPFDFFHGQQSDLGPVQINRYVFHTHVLTSSFY